MELKTPEEKKRRKRAQARVDAQTTDGKQRRALLKQLGFDPNNILKGPMTTADEAMVNASVGSLRQRVRDRAIELFSQGYTTEEIASHLGIKPLQARTLTGAALQDMTQDLSQASVEANFVRYAVFQFGLIRRLSMVIDGNIKAATHTSTVAAMRLQSDALDKVYDKGKELGMMQLNPSTGEAQMNREDLVATLVEEKALLEALIEEVQVTEIRKRTRLKIKAKQSQNARSVAVEQVLTDGHTAKEKQSEQIPNTCDDQEKNCEQTVTDSLAAELEKERNTPR